MNNSINKENLSLLNDDSVKVIELDELTGIILWSSYRSKFPPIILMGSKFLYMNKIRLYKYIANYGFIPKGNPSIVNSYKTGLVVIEIQGLEKTNLNTNIPDDVLTLHKFVLDLLKGELQYES